MWKKAVNSDKIDLTCENKEKFDINQILLDRHVVQDYKGNEVFIVNNYQNPEQFACAISPNSVLPDETKTMRSSFYKFNNKGLSGGAIATIVICSVVAVAIIGITIALVRRGYLSSKKPNTIVHISSSIYNNSSVQQIDHDDKAEEV